jgi:aminocarboxymuconate-semialdehyde decarboxylase
MIALSLPAWQCALHQAGQIVKVNNEKLAELCASRPDRFAAFASLALRRHRRQHAGGDFADPKFHPVWAKAEQLGAVPFVDPQSTPELAKRFKGNGWLSNTIGNPLDTSIALQHLIFEPSIASPASRSSQRMAAPQNCNRNVTPKKKPSEYLQLYFDAMVFTPEGLRHLVAQVGASQVICPLMQIKRERRRRIIKTCPRWRQSEETIPRCCDSSCAKPWSCWR